MIKKRFIAVLCVLLVLSAVLSCYPYYKDTEVVQSILSGLDFLKNDEKKEPSEDEKEPSESEKEEETTVPETTAPITTVPETTVPETTLPETTVPETTLPPETTAPPVTQAPVTQPPVTQPPVVTEPPKDYIPPQPVPAGEFDNALFIGDSRTLGLLYYGGIGNADVFATRGMTAARALSESVSVKSTSYEIKLEPLLQQRKYERIYIMLGINEIGGTIEGISRTYTNLYNKVRAAQPEAQIYLCANLLITHARSLKDPIYNNTRLNAINNFIATLADGGLTKYINVNEIFSDSNGAFGAAYTTDDFHPIPKYYKQWAQWLGTVT